MPAVAGAATAVADIIPAKSGKPSEVAGSTAIGSSSQAPQAGPPTASLPAGPAVPAAWCGKPVEVLAEAAELSNKAATAALQAADVHGHDEISCAVASGKAAQSYILYVAVECTIGSGTSKSTCCENR